MHRYTYTSIKALQGERLRRFGIQSGAHETHTPGFRQRIGHNLIQLGERIARVDRQEELGEAA